MYLIFNLLNILTWVVKFVFITLSLKTAWSFTAWKQTMQAEKRLHGLETNHAGLKQSMLPRNKPSWLETNHIGWKQTTLAGNKSCWLDTREGKLKASQGVTDGHLMVCGRRRTRTGDMSSALGLRKPNTSLRPSLLMGFTVPHSSANRNGRADGVRTVTINYGAPRPPPPHTPGRLCLLLLPLLFLDTLPLLLLPSSSPPHPLPPPPLLLPLLLSFLSPLRELWI